MFLFSIFIVDDDASTALPPMVADNIASFKQHHPSGEHHIFTKPLLREFLLHAYGEDVLAAFDALKPYAYKADLAKYCLLYHFGGIYADLSYNFQNPVFRTEEKLSVFRDFMSCSPWDTSIGVIAAPARHPAMKQAIRLVCENVRLRRLGVNPLCPTGPALFGKAVAMTCQPDDIVAGEAVWLPQDPPPNQIHALFSQGLLIALKTKAGGHPMTTLGIRNGNTYRDFWRQKDIYEIQEEPRGFFAELMRKKRRGEHRILD